MVGGNKWQKRVHHCGLEKQTSLTLFLIFPGFGKRKKTYVYSVLIHCTWKVHVRFTIQTFMVWNQFSSHSVDLEFVPMCRNEHRDGGNIKSLVSKWFYVAMFQCNRSYNYAGTIVSRINLHFTHNFFCIIIYGRTHGGRGWKKSRLCQNLTRCVQSSQT